MIIILIPSNYYTVSFYILTVQIIGGLLHLLVSCIIGSNKISFAFTRIISSIEWTAKNVYVDATGEYL